MVVSYVGPTPSFRTSIAMGNPAEIADRLIVLSETVATNSSINWYMVNSGDSPYLSVFLIEGSLEAKLPTIWRDGNGQPGRNSDVEKVSREKIRDGESQKREDAGARKGRKVAKHCVFPVFCGSGGAKGRLAKAAGAEVAGQMRHEKLHAVVARSTF